MKYKHLFWDFDGTLYDSYPQILNAIEQTFRSFSLPVPSKDELLRETKVLVSRALSTYGGNIPQDELMTRFQSYHHAIASFPLYEGTSQLPKNTALQRNKALSVYASKPDRQKAAGAGRTLAAVHRLRYLRGRLSHEARA